MRLGLLAAQLVLLPAGGAGLAAEEPRWEASLAEAFRRARGEDRLVMAEFWRENCAYCVRLERHTFPDEHVRKALAAFVPVRIKNTEHPAEIERYGVDGFPTLALLEPGGEAVDLHAGYMTPEEFLGWLRAGVERHRRHQALRARIERDPADQAARLELGRLLSGEGRKQAALRLLEAVVESDPEGKRRETVEAHLEIGLLLRRSREYGRGVEAIARARALVLARLEARPAGKATTSGGGDAGGGGDPGDGDLLDRVLFELAMTQVLAGLRQDLLRTLEEYDSRVVGPDARRHARVLLQLGRTRERTGNREGAARAYEKCERLYPRSTEGRDAREALAGLKKAG